ncbi:2-isopropylmalate synthase [Nocardia sp. BMG111209]|uniref:2-isopropylmalate synthase n=1 Tax=Nocardia sp. BMG111209 TaxID=1160137 RepID=UPI000366BC3D|nr:2-isopropylmalate synthase [Nocardia sp. BMG111209]
MPSHRYSDVYHKVSVPLTDRHWPANRITAAPLWVPVDLRDGNQALAEPMDPDRKRRFFELMVTMGYKEIEVGYPSASQTDFDFVRLIGTAGLAPEDVTIVVFTPARRDLIERTMESVAGLTNDVVIHMYTATAPVWRDVVLGRSRAEVAELIRDGGRDILELAGDRENIRFEFSPEVFMLTEPDYVLAVCEEMTALWDATPRRPVILNLPATVEVATPNVYADQIEYMHRNLARRDSVILSVHPHNDRGTGIACAELAVLAGAQRVEGCIFGNGERTGNVDIATLALNLHAQGVDPMIDFSDIDAIRRTVEYCTRMPVPERHPYVGDLVYTAFSGTHQDAIKKGFAEHRERAARLGRSEREIAWQVPYLPIDPADVGRSYDAVIRVNSQSGKGGIAYLLQTEYGLDLPRRLQIDFAHHVQRRTDDTGAEISAATLLDLLTTAYSPTGGRIGLSDCTVQATEVHLNLDVDGVSREYRVPVAALAESLAAEFASDIEVLSVTHQTRRDGSAVAYLEYRIAGKVHWVIGFGETTVCAALNAVIAVAESTLPERRTVQVH